MGRASKRKQERRPSNLGPAKPLLHSSGLAGGITPRSMPHLNLAVVYRFFNDSSHADALADGKVWLSTLETCRRYEDPKQGDPEEGSVTNNSGYAVGDSGDNNFDAIAARSGIHIGPGCSNITLSNNIAIHRLPDAIVLCTTELFDPDGLSETFGRYCVAISDPARLFAQITEQLQEVHNVAQAVYGRVIYRDRYYTGLEKPPGPIGFVKPPDKYQDQHEVRFLWTLSGQEDLQPFLLEVPEATTLCRRVA